eukprot:Rmarinus@m.3746
MVSVKRRQVGGRGPTQPTKSIQRTRTAHLARNAISHKSRPGVLKRLASWIWGATGWTVSSNSDGSESDTMYSDDESDASSDYESDTTSLQHAAKVIARIRRGEGDPKEFEDLVSVLRGAAYNTKAPSKVCSNSWDYDSTTPWSVPRRGPVSETLRPDLQNSPESVPQTAWGGKRLHIEGESPLPGTATGSAIPSRSHASVTPLPVATRPTASTPKSTLTSTASHTAPQESSTSVFRSDAALRETHTVPAATHPTHSLTHPSGPHLSYGSSFVPAQPSGYAPFPALPSSCPPFFGPSPPQYPSDVPPPGQFLAHQYASERNARGPQQNPQYHSMNFNAMTACESDHVLHEMEMAEDLGGRGSGIMSDHGDGAMSAQDAGETTFPNIPSAECVRPRDGSDGSEGTGDGSSSEGSGCEEGSGSSCSEGTSASDEDDGGGSSEGEEDEAPSGDDAAPSDDDDVICIESDSGDSGSEGEGEDEGDYDSGCGSGAGESSPPGPQAEPSAGPSRPSVPPTSKVFPSTSSSAPSLTEKPGDRDSQPRRRHPGGSEARGETAREETAPCSQNTIAARREEQGLVRRSVAETVSESSTVVRSPSDDDGNDGGDGDD